MDGNYNLQHVTTIVSWVIKPRHTSTHHCVPSLLAMRLYPDVDCLPCTLPCTLPWGRPRRMQVFMRSFHPNFCHSLMCLGGRVDLGGPCVAGFFCQLKENHGRDSRGIYFPCLGRFLHLTILPLNPVCEQNIILSRLGCFVQ